MYSIKKKLEFSKDLILCIKISTLYFCKNLALYLKKGKEIIYKKFT